MSEQKKVIAIVGATGAQGGGLAKAILADPGSEFAVRALTRDVTSEKAQELVKLGAEVIEAETDDEAAWSRRSRARTARSWSPTLGGEEEAHMSAPTRSWKRPRMAAARETGRRLQHVIWSTLEDTRDRIPVDDDRMPTLQGKYKVPHFDAKADADALFTDAGVPTTFLRTTFYFENFATGWGPTRGDDGELR